MVLIHGIKCLEENGSIYTYCADTIFLKILTLYGLNYFQQIMFVTAFYTRILKQRMLGKFILEEYKSILHVYSHIE